MTCGWAFHVWFNVVAFPITEGPRWTRGFTSTVCLTVVYLSVFILGQILWYRDIKRGLYKRAIEEEENREALVDKFGPELQDEKPADGEHIEGAQSKEVK